MTYFSIIIWHVWHKDFGHSQSGSHLNLNSNVAKSSVTGANPVHSFDADGISPNIRGGGGGEHNVNNVYYNVWMFATLDGVTKVGSYTGDGNTGRQIDCGFSSGARFILIKAASGAGSWFLWDSVSGIVTGNDPYIELNNTNAQTTGGDNVDPYSSGFIVNGPGNNASGIEYIFLAIA